MIVVVVVQVRNAPVRVPGEAASAFQDARLVRCVPLLMDQTVHYAVVEEAALAQSLRVLLEQLPVEYQADEFVRGELFHEMPSVSGNFLRLCSWVSSKSGLMMRSSLFGGGLAFRLLFRSLSVLILPLKIAQIFLQRTFDNFQVVVKVL